MKSLSLKTMLFTLVFVFSLTAINAQNESKSLLPDEPPSSLFSSDDGNSELILKGYYEGGFETGLAFALDKNYLSSFSMPNSPLLFKQKQDLVFSFLLFKNYFAELNFQEDSSNNTYAIGYKSESSLGLSSVRIGNSDLSFPSYAFLPLGDAKKGTFGATLRYKTENSEIYSVLRYEEARVFTKRYKGKKELIIEQIDAARFEKSLRFVLPHSSISDFTIAVEDVSGSLIDAEGRKYKPLSALDYSVSYAKGSVLLKTSIKERLIVSYTKDLSAPDFSQYLCVSIEGKTYLVLSEPKLLSEWQSSGDYGDFADFSYYALTDAQKSALKNNSAKVSALKTESNEKIVQIQAFYDEALGKLHVENTSNTVTDSLLARKPFSSLNTEIYTNAYNADASLYALSITRLSSAEGFVLGEGLSKGTVSITRNGIPETLFSVDYASGTVTFLHDVAADDLIEIRYVSAEAKRENARLSFGLGIDTKFSETLVGKAALALVINPALLVSSFGVESYSTSASTNPQYFASSFELSNKDEVFSWSQKALVQYKIEDSRPLKRLLSMEESGLIIDLNEQKHASVSFLSAYAPLIELLEANKKPFVFRDFKNYDIFGNYTLMDTSWANAKLISETEKNYPYAVYDSKIKRAVLAFEYKLIKAGDWSSAQYPLSDLQKQSLARAKEIGIYFKNENAASAAYKVFLELGELKSDDETSGLDFASFENTNLIALEEVSASASWSSNEWFQYKLSSPLTAMQKKALINANGFRIIVVQTLSSSISGRFFLGPIVASGSDFVVEKDTGTLSAVEEGDSVLKASFPERMTLFHSEGEAQKVLKITLDNVTGKALVKKAISETELSSYEAFSFFYKSNFTTALNPLLTISFLGSSGSLISAEIPIQALSAYEKITVYYGSNPKVVRQATSSGEETVIPNASVVKNLSETMLVTNMALGLSFSISGVEKGTIYLDEVCLENPRAYVDFLSESSAVYKGKGSALSVFGVSFIDDLSLEAITKAQVRTKADTTIFKAFAYSVIQKVNTAFKSGPFGFDFGFNLVLSDSVFSGDARSVTSFSLFGLSLKDNFSESFRTDTLFHGLSFGYSIEDFNFLYSCENAETLDSRNKKVSLENSFSIFPISIRTKLSLLSAMHLVYSLPIESDYVTRFFTRYYESALVSMSLLDSAAHKRNATLVFELALKDSKNEPFFLLKPSFVTQNSLLVKQDSALNGVFSLTQDFLAFSVKERYERALSSTLEDTLFSSWEGDVERWLRVYNDFPSVYSVPFYDFFAPSESFFSSSLSESLGTKAVNSFELSFARPASLNVLDFFLPQSAKTSISRTVTKSLATLDSFYEGALFLKTDVINLFSSMGSLPLLSFAQGDDASLYSDVVCTFDQNAFRKVKYSLGVNTGIYGFLNEVLIAGMSYANTQSFGLEEAKESELKLEVSYSYAEKNHWLEFLYTLAFPKVNVNEASAPESSKTMEIQNTDKAETQGAEKETSGAQAAEPQSEDDKKQAYLVRLSKAKPRVQSKFTASITSKINEVSFLQNILFPVSFETKLLSLDSFTFTIKGSYDQTLIISKSLFNSYTGVFALSCQCKMSF